MTIEHEIASIKITSAIIIWPHKFTFTTIRLVVECVGRLWPGAKQ